VVDDDAVVLETAVATLEEEFDVVTATCPIAALETLGAATFDVLCTDFQMPELTGLELIARAQAAGHFMGTVLITGREPSYTRALLAETETVEGRLPLCMLVKPYPPGELIGAIRRAATFARMRQAITAMSRRDGA
jgi:CheY-like chemotaxis protein